MMEVHRFKPFKPAITREFKRADIELYGIDHYRRSYSGLILFNAGKVDPKKVTSDHEACAGCFSIFGHPECFGNEGHCTPRPPQRFDSRRSHPLTKAFKRVTVTEGLRAALADRETLEITILVADGEGMRTKKQLKKAKDEGSDPAKLLSISGLQIVTFA